MKQHWGIFVIRHSWILPGFTSYIFSEKTWLVWISLFVAFALFWGCLSENIGVKMDEHLPNNSRDENKTHLKTLAWSISQYYF